MPHQHETCPFYDVCDVSKDDCEYDRFKECVKYKELTNEEWTNDFVVSQFQFGSFARKKKRETIT